MDKRISIDEYYLNVAKAISQRSTCLVRQYGVVIVNRGEIISTGYNGSPRGEVNCCDIGYCKRYNSGPHDHNDGDYDQCESVHAEMNAIISAARKDMIGSTLYLFGTENGNVIDHPIPCPICSRLIKNAGIAQIIS